MKKIKIPSRKNGSDRENQNRVNKGKKLIDGIEILPPKEEDLHPGSLGAGPID